MRKYHQLTKHQRYQIYALKKVGHDQQTIAATVEVCPRRFRGSYILIATNAAIAPAKRTKQALMRRRQKAKVTKMTLEVIKQIEAALHQSRTWNKLLADCKPPTGFN